MKLLFLFALVLLAGCEDSPEYIPLNTMEKANEVCQSMGGVTYIKVKTFKRNSKLYDGKMITKLHLTCKNYEAQVEFRIQWELPNP